MLEKLELFDHGLGIVHRIYRSVHLVFQHEDIPAYLSMVIVIHSGIEPAQNIRRIVLSAGLTYRCLERSGQVVAIERVRWTREVVAARTRTIFQQSVT